MTIYLRVILAFVVLAFIIIMLELISRRTLSLKYSLLWLLVCVVLILLVAFPNLLGIIAHILHIELPINALYLVSIFILMLISLSLTVIVSRQTVRIRNMAQENALMERRIRTIEKLLEEKKEEKK
ncbi:MAG: DUF2304 domain-containing protein [Butyrivibrio sp.]|nr:DUF2304 domain-containing protein [Butyrivibrio sp.]